MIVGEIRWVIDSGRVECVRVTKELDGAVVVKEEGGAGLEWSVFSSNLFVSEYEALEVLVKQLEWAVSQMSERMERLRGGSR